MILKVVVRMGNLFLMTGNGSFGPSNAFGTGARGLPSRRWSIQTARQDAKGLETYMPVRKVRDAKRNIFLRIPQETHDGGLTVTRLEITAL